MGLSQAPVQVNSFKTVAGPGILGRSVYFGFRFRFRFRMRVRVSIGGRVSFFSSFRVRVRGGVRVRFWFGPGTQLDTQNDAPDIMFL